MQMAKRTIVYILKHQSFSFSSSSQNNSLSLELIFDRFSIVSMQIKFKTK